MSKQKKRGKEAKTESKSSNSQSEDSIAENNNSPTAQPPTRNFTALALSSMLLFAWVLFLVYVAIFG